MSIKCSEVVNYNISTGYYRLVMEMFEEEIKYIREYKSLVNDYFKKSLNLQVNLGSKLGKLPDNFANATWLDSSQILKLAQQIPKIIQKQIENLKIFMDEIEKPLNLLDNFFKNKSSEMKKLQQKYDDINNDLVKKYIDIERIKISFTNSINKTEDTIMKSYENKKKIDDAKKGKIKLKEEELKLLNDKNKEYESQKKSLINSTKKYESEYKSIIKTTTKIEDKFIIIINECIIGIKNVVGEITDKFKDTIIAFLTSIRDSFKVPLDLLDNNLTNMKNLNEKEIMDVAMEATFNRESNLKHITPVRYSLRTLENPIIESSKNRSSKGSRGSKGSKGSNGKSKNKNKGENKGNENNNGFVKFEDGFEEMTYFEDDLPLLTVKEMFINFDLINHNGLNIQVEEEKNEAKKYINKLITNMSQESSKILNDYNFINIDECSPFTEEEKLKLKTLLNKHHNRVIFLHKLNDYRTCSLFELKEKEFQTLGELFSFLIDISKKEEDYHCVEMAIILSKTYYMLENNNKIYIQSLIQNNKYFKTKDFWEALLIYSISKEVIRSKKNDEENKDNQEKLNEKNANIVFSQLLSLIDNMFDFGVDGEMIKQIIEPRIEYYKVDEKSRKPINDYIESKIKAKKKNEK
jgi:hypothetical protein